MGPDENVTKSLESLTTEIHQTPTTKEFVSENNNDNFENVNQINHHHFNNDYKKINIDNPSMIKTRNENNQYQQQQSPLDIATNDNLNNKIKNSLIQIQIQKETKPNSNININKNCENSNENLDNNNICSPQSGKESSCGSLPSSDKTTTTKMSTIIATNQIVPVIANENANTGEINQKISNQDQNANLARQHQQQLQQFDNMSTINSYIYDNEFTINELKAFALEYVKQIVSKASELAAERAEARNTLQNVNNNQNNNFTQITKQNQKNKVSLNSKLKLTNNNNNNNKKNQQQTNNNNKNCSPNLDQNQNQNHQQQQQQHHGPTSIYMNDMIKRSTSSYSNSNKKKHRNWMHWTVLLSCCVPNENGDNGTSGTTTNASAAAASSTKTSKGHT